MAIVTIGGSNPRQSLQFEGAGNRERQVQAGYGDRNQKVPRYGAAGIAESWLIDLITRRIERYTEPRPVGYRQVLIARVAKH